MGFHPYDLHRAVRHYNSWERIELDYGGDLDANKFRSAAFGRDPKGNARPPLSDEAAGLTTLDWFAGGEFDAAVDAHSDALDTGVRTDRGGVLTAFEDLSELFLGQADEVEAAQMAGALKASGYRSRPGRSTWRAWPRAGNGTVAGGRVQITGWSPLCQLNPGLLTSSWPT